MSSNSKQPEQIFPTLTKNWSFLSEEYKQAFENAKKYFPKAEDWFWGEYAKIIHVHSEYRIAQYCKGYSKKKVDQNLRLLKKNIEELYDIVHDLPQDVEEALTIPMLGKSKDDTIRLRKLIEHMHFRILHRCKDQNMSAFECAQIANQPNVQRYQSNSHRPHHAAFIIMRLNQLWDYYGYEKPNVSLANGHTGELDDHHKYIHDSLVLAGLINKIPGEYNKAELRSAYEQYRDHHHKFSHLKHRESYYTLKNKDSS